MIISAFVTVLLFDFLWCWGTTFRGMSDIPTYAGAILAALLLTLPYMLARRTWVQMVVLLLFDVWGICNLMYCRTYMEAIPLESYGLVGNLAGFTASVWDSMRWYDALLPISTLAFWVGSHFVTSKWPKLAMRRYLYALSCAGLLMGGCMLLNGGFVNHVERCYNSCYQSNNPTLYYTLAGDLIYDYISGTEELTPEQRQGVEDWLEEHQQMCQYAALPDSLGERRSMVLILLESFESWLLQKEIEEKELTPFLNSLLADSTTFFAPRVLTQVGQGRSIEAQLLINAGLLPMKSVVYSMKYPHNHYNTLTYAIKERAQREGRESTSILLSPDKPYVWNQEQIARSFGIDTLVMEGKWDEREKVGHGQGKLSDRQLCLQSVEKLKKGDLWQPGEDAFVQIVTYSGHNPFRLPEEMKGIHFESQMLPKLNDYITMANYTDASLEPLISYLKSRPDYKDMLIVIVGDHEGLAADRGPSLRDGVGATMVDEEQFSPLIVLNSPYGGRYDEVMGQVDIYPTLLGLMGLDDYSWKGVGESVLNPSKAPFAISTMTNKIVGDTASVAPEKMRHIFGARDVSDKLIIGAKKNQ